MIRVLTHYHMSSQVFTARYALNAHDSIKESSLLEKKLRAIVTLPLSSTVCMYVCMYVYLYVRMYACMYVCMYVCMYIHTYARTYVHMYVCM